AAGRRPTGLPTIQLRATEQATVQRVLLKVVPAASRGDVAPTVTAALETGDIASALAAVGPFALRDKASGAMLDLTNLAGAATWDVTPILKQNGVDLSAVKTARSLTKLVLPIQIVAMLIGFAAFALLWLSGAPATYRRALVSGACSRSPGRSLSRSRSWCGGGSPR